MGFCVRASALEGHDQGVDDQVGIGRGSTWPSRRPGGVQVDHAGEVEPTLTGPELGDVGRPDLVWPGREKFRFTRSGGGSGVGTAGAPALAGMGADQALGGHEAGDTLATTALVETTQFGMDPRRAIGRARAPMDLADETRPAHHLFGHAPTGGRRDQV